MIFLNDLKTPDQDNCQVGPNGECVVPAYQQLNFNITQYTDDSFSMASLEEGPLIANDMVYLAVEASDMNQGDHRRRPGAAQAKSQAACRRPVV